MGSSCGQPKLRLANFVENLITPYKPTSEKWYSLYMQIWYA